MAAAEENMIIADLACAERRENVRIAISNRPDRAAYLAAYLTNKVIGSSIMARP